MIYLLIYVAVQQPTLVGMRLSNGRSAVELQSNGSRTAVE